MIICVTSALFYSRPIFLLHWLHVTVVLIQAHPNVDHATFCPADMKKKSEVHQRQRDTESARARGTQNIIFGSLFEHLCQSLSLPSNCERRATPSGIVEHNLAAAAL